jgi:hypothetical protein
VYAIVYTKGLLGNPLKGFPCSFMPFFRVYGQLKKVKNKIIKIEKKYPNPRLARAFRSRYSYGTTERNHPLRGLPETGCGQNHDIKRLGPSEGGSWRDCLY